MRDDARPYHDPGGDANQRRNPFAVFAARTLGQRARAAAPSTGADTQLEHHFKGRAAASTVEALMFGLRERGTAALKEAPVRRRLGELSKDQLREVATRLQSLKLTRAWTAGEIDRLLETWDVLHE